MKRFVAWDDDDDDNDVGRHVRAVPYNLTEGANWVESASSAISDRLDCEPAAPCSNDENTQRKSAAAAFLLCYI